MTSIVHARNENALRNGSFIHERKGKTHSTYARYINGDFIGWIATLPDELKQASQQWTLRDAKKLMPRGT